MESLLLQSGIFNNVHTCTTNGLALIKLIKSLQTPKTSIDQQVLTVHIFVPRLIAIIKQDR